MATITMRKRFLHGIMIPPCDQARPTNSAPAIGKMRYIGRGGVPVINAGCRCGCRGRTRGDTDVG
jgi:hypothetical protein